MTKNKIEKKSNWIMFNTSEDTWQKLLVYYRWTLTIVLLALAIVLLIDRVYLLGLCVFLLFLYVVPIKAIRQYDQKLGKFKKKLILYGIIACSAAAIYLMVGKIA